MVEKIERNELFKKLITLIPFLSAILCFIVQGWIGLLFVFIATFIIMLSYYSYHYICINRWKYNAQEFFSITATSHYLDWQQKLLQLIYSDLEIVSILGKKYPAAILRAETDINYPFTGLCNLHSLDIPSFELDKKQNQFVKILGKSLKAPKMKGFALSKIHLNAENKTKSFDAITITQIQNIATCHILEWELFQYYKLLNNKEFDSINEVLKTLKYRSYYHNNRNGLSAIVGPHKAFPLISVQALVIFKDSRGMGPNVWRVVIAKRSKDVLVKPGFFQFIPAGGFEVFGNQDDDVDYLVKKGFNIGDAVLREYAEEIFNIEEFQENFDGRDPYSIRSHPITSRLIEAIKKKTAWFEFIGTIFDLTVLRPELSFLIIIEDDFFCKSELLSNWESKNIMSPKVDEIKSIFSNNIVHGSSAGILQLSTENKKIQKLGILSSLEKS